MCIVRPFKLIEVKCQINVVECFDIIYHHIGLKHDLSIVEATRLVDNSIIKEILLLVRSPHGTVIVNQLMSRCVIGFMDIHIKHYGIISCDLFIFSYCACFFLCSNFGSYVYQLVFLMYTKRILTRIVEIKGHTLEN